MGNLNDLLIECFRSFPDKTALLADDEVISYRRLESDAMKIVSAIRNYQSSNSVVGVYLPRSANSVKSFVSVLLSGSAYLPIDISYPPERIKSILTDSNPDCIITDSFYFGEISNYTDNIVDINKLPEQKIDTEFSSAADDDVAYILFTSGSTGIPKGVMIEHNSVFNFLNAFNKVAPHEGNIVGLSLCPFTFDVSVWEIFSVLCFGGTLNIVDTNSIIDFEFLTDFIINNKITNLYIPPGILSPLSEVLSKQNKEICIKRILVGVEAIRQKILKKYLDIIPGIKIINGYGPTEATICSTFYRFLSSDAPEENTPIGKPVEGYEVYIVNEKYDILPDGKTGEIIVGGTGLSRGYLNRPELNKELFISKNFIKNGSNRFYLTGDLGSVTHSGNIVFKGRKDNQVKFHGYRIELGEIENVLLKFEGVSESCVQIKSFSEDSKLLLCYYSGSEKINENLLIKHLAKYLPDYMIPSDFLFLEKLPRTKEGKIDKRVLLNMEIESKGISVYDISNLETDLLEIYKEALKLNSCKLDDNFFKLGGKSLIAVRIITKIYKLFNVNIGFNFFFNNPVIREIFDELKFNLSGKCQIDKDINLETESRKNKVLISPAQSRVWMIEEFSKGAGLFNIPLYFNLKGEFDTLLLEKSINVLIKRHRILRTKFNDFGGDIYQVIENEFAYKLNIIEIPDSGDENIFIRNFIEKEEIFSFNFSLLPLFRITVIKKNYHDYFIAINIHHIISDNWSVGLFIRELSQIYNLLASGEIISEDEYPYQYQDFSEYFNKWLESDSARNEISYWKNKLSGINLVLNLPYDKPRPKYMTFLGNELQVTLCPVLKQDITSYCERNNISVFMFLFACYGLLMSRIGGQKDFVIGIPIANRIKDEFSEILGMMINNLPVLISCRDNESPLSFINAVKKELVEVYDHQKLPFEKIVNALKLERDMSHSLVYQVMFNYLEEYRDLLSLNGTEIKYIEYSRKRSHLDLTLSAYNLKDNIKLIFEYNSYIFSEERIHLYSEIFKKIVTEILLNDSKAICNIDILPEHELVFLCDYNKTEFALSEFSILEHIENFSVSLPDKDAVIFNGNVITYSELKLLTNNIAGNILSKISPGRKVGIYLNRSENIILSIIGIWKAGCCFIPLDPEYPDSRIKQIINEAKPDLIIADEKTINKQVINGFFNVLISELIVNSNSDAAPDLKCNDLAYIIFTSGSTGKPKGVEISHIALKNFIQTVSEKISFSADDVLLAVTTISFDISILEFITPLFNGGKLIIAGKFDAKDGFALISLINKYKVSFLQGTPATFRILLESNWQSNRELNILCGGEAFPKDLAAELSGKCKSLFNMYGPTETTIWSAMKKVDLKDIEDSSPQYISIGKPLGNTQIFVLDDNLSPLPRGIHGQICIGGLGIAEGYYNDFEMTVSKFVDLPDRLKINNVYLKYVEKKFHGYRHKLFLTGDYGYFDFNGNLNFIGRNDNQIKIRGFRIDLSEIEAALSSLHGVTRNAVKIVSKSDGSKYIAAYVTLDKIPEITTDKIKSYLKAELPDYMQPRFVIVLDTFPLTANGKIDRKNLPDPDITSSEHFQSKKIDVSTHSEALLFKLWKDILQINAFDLESDFFELGGNSILAVKLVSKIEKETGIRLPLALLFENRTIKSLADFIDKEQTINWKSIVPIKATGHKKPLYILHGAGINLLLFTTLINKLDPEQPVYGLQAKGLNGIDEPLKTIEEMSSFYISEILKFDNSGSYRLGGVSFGGTLAYEMARQLTSMGFATEFVGLFDTVAYSSNRNRNFIIRSFQFIHLNIMKAVFALTKTIRLRGDSRKKFFIDKINSFLKKFKFKDYYSYERIIDMGLDKNESKEIPEYMKKVMQANFNALENYILKPAGIKVYLFRAEERTFYIKNTYDYGWSAYALNGVEIFDVPGTHNTIFAPPNDAVFAKILQSCLDNNEIE